MSRRRQTKTQPQKSAAPQTLSVLRSIRPALIVGMLALFLSIFAGQIYDRVIPDPAAVSLFELAAGPLAFILAGVALILAVPKATPVGRLQWPGLFFAAFLLWSAISLLSARYLFASINALTIAAAAVTVGAAIRRTAGSWRSALLVMAAITAGATLIAAMGIQEYVRQWKGGNSLWRVYATFTNPDFLAGYLIITLPLALALFLAARETYAKMLAACSLLLQVICLLLTGSRLGLGGLFVALVVQGALVVRSGALGPATRRWAMIAGAVLAVALVVAGRPLLVRLLASATEAHSAKFRLYTWRGATAMAKSNPVMGTGIGTFETAYPPYAMVGYTQHAHNTFLQLAGETGLPGLLLLAAGIGGVLGAGMSRLLLQRANSETNGSGPAPESSLLLAGTAASILGGVFHNLFDSDLYVPATALTFGAVCGLCLALSERSAPETASLPAKPSRPEWARWGAIALAVVLIVRAGTVAASRVAANDAAEAIADGRGADAIAAYRQAGSLDPWNVDYPLTMARLMEGCAQPAQAERMYKEAIQVAPIGKPYYQYGRFLSRVARTADAVKQHATARSLEPNNLQNLLALADAYRADNRQAEAERVYQDMIFMARQPVGVIRALPELVDWEYGMAYAGLGEAQYLRKEYAAAEPNLRGGAGILENLWITRIWEIAQLRISPAVRQRTSQRYDEVLTLWESTLRALGKTQEADEVKAKHDTFFSERAKDEEKTSQETGSPMP